MLKKIMISNINSIGQCCIDFRPGKFKYLEDMVINGVVNPISLYGNNGSGKSSIIDAIGVLVNLMICSPDEMPLFMCNYINYKNVTNKFESLSDGKSVVLSNSELEKLTSRITLEYSLDDNEYIYSLATCFDSIIEEKLICNEIAEINFYNLEGLKSNKGNTFPLLRQEYINHTKNENIIKSYEFISNIAVVSSDRQTYTIKTLKTRSSDELLCEKSDEVREILKDKFNMPLFSIKRKTPVESFEKSSNQARRYYIELLAGDDKLELPINFLSEGMLNQSFLLSVLLSLPKNAVLVVDELEQALHPITIKSFLEVVKERGVQLLFSSHNTSILQQLRPDQVYFSKWTKGFSTCKRLSEIYPNIREVNNIEKMYLSNMFEDDK